VETVSPRSEATYNQLHQDFSPEVEDVSEHEAGKKRNIAAETGAKEDSPPATLQESQPAGAESFDSSA
jgi:hypothetical protein